MKWLGVAISVTCLLLACDSEKDQYAGLGELVAERQEIRKSIAEENAKRKGAHLQEDEKERINVHAAKGEDSPSADVVYEKQIEILDSDSKTPLAKGVAYLNKSGQIVKIIVYRK